MAALQRRKSLFLTNFKGLLILSSHIFHPLNLIYLLYDSMMQTAQLLRLTTVGKGVSGETVKRSDDGPSVVSYAEAVKGKQYVIE